MRMVEMGSDIRSWSEMRCEPYWEIRWANISRSEYIWPISAITKQVIMQCFANWMRYAKLEQNAMLILNYLAKHEDGWDGIRYAKLEQVLNEAYWIICRVKIRAKQAYMTHISHHQTKGRGGRVAEGNRLLTCALSGARWFESSPLRI